MPKGFSCLPPEHFRIVEDAIRREPLLYLHELSNLVQTQIGIRYSNEQVYSALENAGYTYKVLDFRAREQSAPARAFFMATMGGFSAHQLVFVDESHAKPEDVRRKYGYALRGQPAFMYIYNVAHGDSPPLSAVCALSTDGMLGFREVKESVTSQLFLDVLQHDILPHLNPFPGRNSVIVLDNARVHDFADINLLCAHFIEMRYFVVNFVVK